MTTKFPTKFYHFRQNNTHGYFAKPYRIIIIEAANHEEANRLALESGYIYFDGSRDCPCCGNRWSEVQGYDGEDTLEIPTEIHWGGTILVKFLDGREEIHEVKG